MLMLMIGLALAQPALEETPADSPTLADALIDNGLVDDGASMYRRLIAQEPHGPMAPTYQHHIVKALRDAGRVDEALDAILVQMNDFGPHSDWAYANAADPERVKQALGYVEENLRSVATEFEDKAEHLEGAEATQAIEVAYRAYQLYLERFPDGDAAFDFHEALADLLLRMGRYEEATHHYMEAIELAVGSVDAGRCMDGAVSSASRDLDEARAAGLPEPPADPLMEVPPTEHHRRALMALQVSVEGHPDPARSNEARFNQGFILYELRRYDLAVDLLLEAIRADPSARNGPVAVGLIFEARTLQEAWTILEFESLELYELEGFGNASYKRGLLAAHERAVLHGMDARLEGKEQAKAAKKWLRKHPDTDVADLALHVQAQGWVGAGKPEKAEAVRARLKAEYPKSEYL